MKEKDKKIILRGLILFVVLCAVFYGLNEMCRVAVLNERYEIIKQVDYMPEGSIDVLIVGNSHAQEGINSYLMSDMLDKKVLNFSFSQQQTATAYYFLEKNLKKQSPKVVVLEAYTLIQQVQGGYEFISLNSSKIKHFKMLGEEGDFVDSFLPIVGNHNFWANPEPFKPLFQNANAGKKEVPPFFSSKIMSESAVKKHEIYSSQTRAKRLCVYRLEHLKQIKRLCDENGAQLIMTMLPLYKTLVDRLDYDALYYDTIKNFCDENGILYYDFNKESPTDWVYKYFREQDYTQNTHLNSYGQILASAELARYLAGAVGFLSLNEYETPEIKISAFMDSIDPSGSLLIIDDCPNPLNANINPDVAARLENLGIKPVSKKEEDEGPDIYLLSGDGVLYDYVLPEGFKYDEYGVTLCEIDGSGEIKKRAVARWDEFDTAIIR